jgi:hypothetical protein
VRQLRAVLDEDRKSPEGVLRDFAVRFWYGRTDSFALAEWTAFARESPAAAAEILATLGATAEDPPPATADILRRYGNIHLPDDATYARWLRQTVETFAGAGAGPPAAT